MARELVEQLIDAVADGALCRLGGHGRAGGRDVVAVGTILRVPDAGDDRDLACEDCAAQALVVERDEVGDRTTTSREDDHVDAAHSLQAGERVNDRAHRFHSLDGGGADDDVLRGKALAQMPNDVHHGVGASSGHDSDTTWESPQRLAPARVTEPVGLEAGQCLRAPAQQLSLARVLDGVDDELRRSARRVEVDALVVRLNEVALLGQRLTDAHAALPDAGVEVGVLVGQRKVDVTRAVQRDVADLAFHPAVAEVPQRPVDAVGDLRYRRSGSRDG